MDKKKMIVSDQWRTPKWLLNELGYFDFDPCPFNAKVDGLSVVWFGRVFCNPPYSEIEKWIEKAIFELTSNHCYEVVMLLPSWETQSWFQGMIRKYYYRDIGYLKFDGLYQNKGVASFRSVLFRMKK